MKYYLSVPCVGCPWVSKGLKGQACLVVHCFSFSPSLHHAQLSKHSPFIGLGRQKEDQHMVTKTKSSLCLTEAGISCFTIFGKDVSG